MDIQAFKTLLLVRDLGSIAAAARALDLDASNVSRTVAHAERSLGIRLFQRSTRKLSLTEEGAFYLARIGPLVEDLEAAGEEAATRGGLPKGTVKITASVAFSQEGLMPVLPVFQERYPDLTVELYPSDYNMDLLADGLDLAVRLAAAPKGDLIATKLFQSHYRVVASPEFLENVGPVAHPRDLSSLNCLCFALPGFRSTWSFKRENDRPFQVEVSGKTVIASALSLREGARLGMGVALLASWLIRRDLEDGRLVDVFPQYACAARDFDTAAWILYPSKLYLPRKVRVMIDFLKAELG